MDVEKEVMDIRILVTESVDRGKSNTKRLDEIEQMQKEQTNLIVAIKELAVETKYMREDLNAAMQRIAKLETKDGESWTKFKWLIIASVVGIIIGYIAKELLK